MPRLEIKSKEGDKRRKFTPTDEQRKIVERCSGQGVPEKMIAKIIGVALETLILHFRDNLELGKAMAADRKTRMLEDYIANGGREGLTALIFSLKAQFGWRDTARVELSGPDGEPFKVNITVNAKAKVGTVDQS